MEYFPLLSSSPDSVIRESSVVSTRNDANHLGGMVLADSGAPSKNTPGSDSRDRIQPGSRHAVETRDETFEANEPIDRIRRCVRPRQQRHASTLR